MLTIEEELVMPDEAASAHPPPRRPHRRWLRYSLRSLLLLTALLAIWLGIKVNQARRQREAVEKLTSLGAQITYDIDLDVIRWARDLCGDDFFRTVRSVSFVGRLSAHRTQSIPHTFTDQDLSCLADLRQLELLYIANAPITDEGLLHLAGHKSLTTIHLNNTAINGSGFRHLAVPNLVEIGLNGTRVNDAALSHLRKAKNLQRLQLAGTEITDEGLKYLRGLSKLEGLVISRTRITGSGLKYLSGLRELREIYMAGCPVKGESLLSLNRLKPSAGSFLIDLNDTPLGDQDIAYLIQLKNLWSVSLNRTKVTDAGLADLHRMTKLISFYSIEGMTEQDLTMRRIAQPMIQPVISGPKRY
jgi:hypothetical protein